MDLGLRSKVALVTGGSRGIGRAIAFGLVEEGALVAICARSEGRLEQTTEELRAAGGTVLPIVADMTGPEGPATVIARTVAEFGGLDILVNNVGGGGAATFMGTDDETWQSAIDLSVWPTIRASRLAVPHLEARGGGCITIISSIYGREWGGRPAYMTVKAAENALAKSLARELAPKNIRVNAVAPGSIMFPGGGWDLRTQADPEGMAAFVTSDMPFGRWGRPEEVANVVVFLSSERASLMSGACVNVDGCQSRSLI
ncbi:MAG: SDR family oxidoreductase [Chloroflexi bacterium]|nr:SDR family oxidoreductase [Chloroflexota bacterium]